jgi:hypothetical protein
MASDLSSDVESSEVAIGPADTKRRVRDASKGFPIISRSSKEEHFPVHTPSKASRTALIVSEQAYSPNENPKIGTLRSVVFSNHLPTRGR